MKRNIGIMQGRLSPPVGAAIQAFPLSTWRNEFALAEQAGLSHIEWIFDREDLLNPILSPDGVAEMLAFSTRTGVRINSVCADYFMSELLLSGSPVEQRTRAEKLVFLIAQCAAAQVSHVVLPFVDTSRIDGDDERERLISLLHFLLPTLRLHHIELHLESSLAPSPFALLLEKIESPFIRINYDTGNSAALGYDIREEFAAYGRWIASIHIKDRLKGGSTVALGQGNVDFPLAARLLKDIGYQGDFTLQVARSGPGAEVPWAIHNLNVCKIFT